MTTTAQVKRYARQTFMEIEQLRTPQQWTDFAIQNGYTDHKFLPSILKNFEAQGLIVDDTDVQNIIQRLEATCKENQEARKMSVNLSAVDALIKNFEESHQLKEATKNSIQMNRNGADIVKEPVLILNSLVPKPLPTRSKSFMTPRMCAYRNESQTYHTPHLHSITPEGFKSQTLQRMVDSVPLQTSTPIENNDSLDLEISDKPVQKIRQTNSEKQIIDASTSIRQSILKESDKEPQQNRLYDRKTFMEIRDSKTVEQWVECGIQNGLSDDVLFIPGILREIVTDDGVKSVINSSKHVLPPHLRACTQYPEVDSLIQGIQDISMKNNERAVVASNEQMSHRNQQAPSPSASFGSNRRPLPPFTSSNASPIQVALPVETHVMQKKENRIIQRFHEKQDSLVSASRIPITCNRNAFQRIGNLSSATPSILDNASSSILNNAGTSILNNGSLSNRITKEEVDSTNVAVHASCQENNNANALFFKLVLAEFEVMDADKQKAFKKEVTKLIYGQ